MFQRESELAKRKPYISREASCRKLRRSIKNKSELLGIFRQN